MKRKITAFLIAFFTLFVLCVSASAESIFSGCVVACSTETIVAPFGGYIEKLYVQDGEAIAAGADVSLLETEKVYANVDGIITGVFAHEGDLSESVVQRYGALLYIEPSNRFTLSCSTEKGYSISENKYIHIGETVYLSCTKDGSHFGKGFVSVLDDEDPKKFSVEVTEGEFYMNETVGVFRAADYTSMSRIGRGTVARTAPIPVTADGSVLELHVSSGDSVKRGQLLFESVPSSLDQLEPISSLVKSKADGIVVSIDSPPGTKVEKGTPIITVYPRDSIKIRMTISEADLAEVSVGDEVLIEFNWNPDRENRYAGTVSSISYIGESDGGQTSGVNYYTYIDFVPDKDIRIGMTTVIYMQ